MASRKKVFLFADVREGSVPVAEAETALQTGLADLQWSGVGELDGIAGANDAVAACIHLLKWFVLFVLLLNILVHQYACEMLLLGGAYKYLCIALHFIHTLVSEVGAHACRSLDSGAADDAHLFTSLQQKLREPSKSTARNACVALGALCCATPLPPQPPVDTARMLLDIVMDKKYSPSTAAGAMTSMHEHLVQNGLKVFRVWRNG